MQSLPERVRIVLCNPKTSANIGAVCRAMKTMGVTRLDIVDPAVPVDEQEVRMMAVHAADIYDQARHLNTLQESINDAALVAGTSRRQGNHRNQPRFSPESFARYAAGFGDGEIAVVFGNEEHGLTTEQLRACSVVLSIPTSPSFPSLNLSHAVQIVCYALFRSSVQPSTRLTITQDRLAQLVATTINSFTILGFFRVFSSRDTERLFREVFARSALSPQEADRLEKMFQKIPFVRAKQDDIPHESEEQ